MAYKPFKMKGSPMKRNFGIDSKGTPKTWSEVNRPKSPAKHGELGESKGWHREYSEHDGRSEHWHPVSGNTSYSDKGSKQETEKEQREEAADKESPAKHDLKGKEHRHATKYETKMERAGRGSELRQQQAQRKQATKDFKASAQRMTDHSRKKAAADEKSPAKRSSAAKHRVGLNKVPTKSELHHNTRHHQGEWDDDHKPKK